MKQEHEALKHLFRQEFSKMVAVISKLFGLEYIETAEDIVSETFLQATETWATKGMPPNPEAWLYAVAKQKTLSYLRRDKIFREKVAPAVKESEVALYDDNTLNFSTQNIQDSQLQMLFAVCDRSIAGEAQIGLALRILCGFGIHEIAEAFLSNKETINKRLFRAKERLRTENIQLQLPSEYEIGMRLDNVLHIIYLLFSEGYYSKTQDQILRKELCIEAMRLCLMLIDYDKTNLPKTNALMALMCFHASRFNARQTANDSFVLYDHQDKTLWDQALINRGIHFLSLSAQGDSLSSYHLEARIAFWHCHMEDTTTKWKEVLQLYDDLLLINYSPSVALNRLFALYKVKGAKIAITEALNLKMEHSHFYFILLGELYRSIDAAKAKQCLERAFLLAQAPAEKQNILLKLEALK